MGEGSEGVDVGDRVRERGKVRWERGAKVWTSAIELVGGEG